MGHLLIIILQKLSTYRSYTTKYNTNMLWNIVLLVDIGIFYCYYYQIGKQSSFI